MEELYINNILIDLPENSVSRTLQINDVGDIEDRQANYSNNIKIPRTSKNIKTFEMLGIQGSNTRIQYTNVSIKYVVNGIELISNGYGVVKKTNEYYNLVVYDGNIAMSDLLGSKQLNSLDFSLYNHTLSNSLFLNSFTNTSGYIYGLAKYYDGFNTDVFDVNLITPSFFVSTLFEIIFTQKGYSITGDIFSNYDYLSRVISMNNGYERIETENKMLVFSRDNSTDPEVLDTFDIQTLKEYLIDSYVVTSDNTHNININGLISLISVGENPAINVNVNGISLLSENIEGLSSLEYNTNVYAKTGDVITVTLLLDSVDVSGTQTINYETNYTTTIETNNITIPIDFSKIIGEETQIDFVKDIMQRFGLVFRKIRNKKEFEFIQIKELLTDLEGAEDWSNKYSNFTSEEYKSSYGQINKIKYIYDDNDTGITPTFGNGEILIDDVNLTSEKTLFTSLFKASELTDSSLCKLQQWEDVEEDDITTIIPKEDGIRIFKINKLTDSFKFRFNNSVQNSATFNGAVAYLDFNSINYQNEISTYYPEFVGMLNNYKSITLGLNLSIIDIYNLDFFKLKYFNQLGKYYYLNKVSSYKPNKITKVELIQISDKILGENEIIGNYSGYSTYSATLTSVSYGGMIGSYNGNSNYMATLRVSVLKDFLMSDGVDESLVCSETPNTTYYHNGVSSNPSINDTIYTDSLGSSPVVGNNKYFKIPLGEYVQINNSGLVISKSFCI